MPGFFLDVDDISGRNTVRSFFNGVVDFQGVQKNLNKNCSDSTVKSYQCFFPQYALRSIRAPYFILNSAYDVYQFFQNFVPRSSDPRGLRSAMLMALKPFEGESKVGMFINSCFSHCQSESQDTWFAPNSPRLHDKTIAKLVGDWFFERGAAQEVDCPYPCDSTCHNIIPF
ncbi:unnamed protein product [Triticum turgidum subsp. durum]|uniref:Pectin acetylesterase n=1 Tax=Triticum turgidum subsp. durum TaxID=4567 RepID=A0A9R0WTN0_TRITD|nr:unnamed protein product [Triticum turgidum subsp. durum]